MRWPLKILRWINGDAWMIVNGYMPEPGTDHADSFDFGDAYQELFRRQQELWEIQERGRRLDAELVLKEAEQSCANQVAKRAVERLTEIELRAIKEVVTNRALWPGLLTWCTLCEREHAPDPYVWHSTEELD